MRTRQVVGSSVLVLVCMVGTAWAATPARRQCALPVVAKGPALSGDLSAPEWAQAAVLDGFRLLDGKGAPEAQTEVRVLADDTSLYVGFVCREPSLDKLVAEISEPGGNVWADDCVEVMIDPTNAKAFHHHLIVNSKGVTWQGLHSIAGSLPRRAETVAVRTALGDERWTCEVIIPFTLLGATPRPGEIWGLNVGRERKAGRSEVSSWEDATTFTDSTQLGEARVPDVGGPPQLTVESRGGVSALFNDHGLNTFAVTVRNRGATEVPVKLVVLTDDAPIGSADVSVGAGVQRAVRAPYEVPADGAGRIFFRILLADAMVYETSFEVLRATQRPARTWVVEDPLFSELVGDQSPGLARYGALMWTHALAGGLLRETAKRFAVRYSLEAAYRDFGRHGLIPVGGGLAEGERAVMYGRYGIGNLAYLKDLPDGVPWALDPRAFESFCASLEDLMAKPHPHLWGVFAGDELDCIAMAQGVRLKAAPPTGYDYIRQADEEVKARFGGGKWGIPDGADDRNPYRWIAYHKWALARLRERHARMHEIIRRHDRTMPMVSTDPTAGVHGFEYSLQAPYFDIFTHQHLPRQERWRQFLGFLSKVLADTTGKEAWPCGHVENYGMATTPEEAVEELSQVLRNGGHGYHLYMPDTANGNNLVGDTRITQFGSPRRHQTVLNIVTCTRTLSRLKYPEYQRTAVVYNDDCMQSTYRATNRTYWYLTESCYTFIGPIARSWFRFIDTPQVLASPSLREAFDVIYLPTAVYQQPPIVSRLRAFVEAGGTLVCGDPKAFETDTLGNDTTAARADLFGVRVGGRIRPGRMTVSAGGKTHDLAIYGDAYALTTTDAETEVLARFASSEPAIVARHRGKGRAILFAANPFQFRAHEDAAWRAFFTDWTRDLGAPTGLDIWRFRFPSEVIWAPAERADYCLTNNHVDWREESPRFPRNLDSGGTYAYSLSPDSWADTAAEGAIAMGAGKLTDRRASIKAEKTEPRWYAPYRLPASRWVVRWQKLDPVVITFDLGDAFIPTEVKLWFSEALPEVRVEASTDGVTWQALGYTAGQDAGADVLDVAIPLTPGPPRRRVRVCLAARAAGKALSLVESEVWGNRPSARGD